MMEKKYRLRCPWILCHGTPYFHTTEMQRLVRYVTGRRRDRNRPATYFRSEIRAGIRSSVDCDGTSVRYMTAEVEEQTRRGSGKAMIELRVNMRQKYLMKEAKEQKCSSEASAEDPGGKVTDRQVENSWDQPCREAEGTGEVSDDDLDVGHEEVEIQNVVSLHDYHHGAS